MKSDLEIAQAATLKPITEIAADVGLGDDDIELHGKYKAKVSLDVIGRLKALPDAKYIDVTAVTPTPLGEGKTVTTIGLSLGLARIGKKVVTTIRQPSLGPVFGIKGGAAGGGYAQVVPMEDFNLHLTGDVHAVSLANNLMCAFVDNSWFKGNPHDIDPRTISVRRVVDVSDRFLRNVTIGLGGEADGIPREAGFDIAVASEVMAILALATDLKDLRRRLGRMVVAYNGKGKPVTAEDVKVAGAMTVLLRDAIKPTLLQTLEHTPCLVHAGPFANIAHGNSSVIADLIGIKLGEYLVTESGFGADCGMEKFMNIKCRTSGLTPDCVVMVATIRALKMHSGRFTIVPGRPLDRGLVEENLPALEEGCCNLVKHIENAKLFGVPVVVAINRFTPDTDKEIEHVRRVAMEAGAEDAVVSTVWAEGGAGGEALARAVVKACQAGAQFRYLYTDDMPIHEKIETIATKIYGAGSVEYTTAAKVKLVRYAGLKYDRFPICMAKTHLSLSHDPQFKGRPRGFVLPVRDIRASVGAGFLYPLCGKMRTMPGLPTEPAGNHVDITEDGDVVGLF
jgi:formate--tetrahydrofolate ligase